MLISFLLVDSLYIAFAQFKFSSEEILPNMRTSSIPCFITVCSIIIALFSIALSTLHWISLLLRVHDMVIPSGYVKGKVNLIWSVIDWDNSPVIVNIPFSLHESWLIDLYVNVGGIFVVSEASATSFLSMDFLVKTGSKAFSSVGIPEIPSELLNLKE